MCGRYELHSNPAVIALAFGLAYPPEVRPRYNVAPTDEVPIVRINANGERELARMRWGLVPRWAKDPAIGARMINARAETVAERPAFKMPYRFHRCLLPADGFYEWMAGPRSGSRRTPQHIAMADGSLFGFAGIYERWRSEEGEVIDSCAIITTDANALLRPIHDRMPVIVPPEHYARWIDPANADVADLLVPYTATPMTYHAVSPRVGNVRFDDAALIEPVEPPPKAVEEPPPPAVPEQESLF